jgi:hypothetical protein
MLLGFKATCEIDAAQRNWCDFILERLKNPSILESLGYEEL